MLDVARLRRPLIALLLLFLTLLSAVAQAQQKRFAQAVDLTARQGLQAKLPPHLATLLGLAQEQECPVMQGVERSGKIVQGIDVSIADKNDVVLFVVDETANDQTLYLTSSQGKLRRIVSVRAGQGAVARITVADRKVFEQQKQFWIDRLLPAPPSKAPPTAKPR